MVRVRSAIIFAAVVSAFSLNVFTACGAYADDTTTGITNLKQSLPPQVLSAKADKVRKNFWLAYQLASYEWLDKVAEADPSIIAAICSHAGSARVLAAHPHISQIADADHYLCRRLCRWRRATDVLVRSPYADHVIALDPQGFVMAMDRSPVNARIIAGNRQFNELIYNDPELGKQIAEHISGAAFHEH